MTAPKTLLELAGADLRPPRLRDACLVLIDLQNEYLSGPLALHEAEQAVANAEKLLKLARESGAGARELRQRRGRAGAVGEAEPLTARYEAVQVLRLG